MNSMTGFGTGAAEAKDLGALSVEIRSVNNRFLDVMVRLPQELTSFEPLARAMVQKRLSRGKVYVNIHFMPIPGATEQYIINEPLLQRLEDFCRSRGQQPDVQALLRIEGAVIAQTDESRLEELGKTLEEALKRALDAMEKERQREGALLREALAVIHRDMADRVAAVNEARAAVTEKYRERLAERIEELLGPKAGTLDPGRLEQEVALFADKADIGEEVTRLGAHLERMAELLQPGSKDAKGRALDFLAQEILREVNTIGSKARDLDITRQVLELKNLVESLKEQIANLE
jgi:uncharacterized protein (TIGR00255 family)